jgi:hypothetical protein
MPRKTCSVAALLNEVNAMLKDSICSPETRLGMCSVIESVLHQTDNYHGFRYLSASEVPYKQLPGMNDIPFDCDTDTDWLYEQRFINTDDSRRHYF